jgi:hypothetical protein
MWSRPDPISIELKSMVSITYIFRDAGLSTTSFGISCNGDREGGMPNGKLGGNGNSPGGIRPLLPGSGKTGGMVGVLVGAGVDFRIPAARKLARRAPGSDAGAAGVGVGIEGYCGCMYDGCGERTAGTVCTG